MPPPKAAACHQGRAPGGPPRCINSVPDLWYLERGTTAAQPSQNAKTQVVDQAMPIPTFHSMHSALHTDPKTLISTKTENSTRPRHGWRDHPTFLSNHIHQAMPIPTFTACTVHSTRIQKHGFSRKWRTALDSGTDGEITPLIYPTKYIKLCPFPLSQHAQDPRSQHTFPYPFPCFLQKDKEGWVNRSTATFPNPHP